MTPQRFHPGADHNPNARDCANRSQQMSAAGRLNLLLSYAGWKHDSWAHHLPRLLEPLGVRSLRASTGHQASELIKTYPIHIAVVDLGLPLGMPGESRADQEAGARMLELLARLEEPPPTVVITRGKSRREEMRELNAALRSGAYACLPRPDTLGDLEQLLDVLRRCLVRHYANRWPGVEAPADPPDLQNHSST